MREGGFFSRNLSQSILQKPQMEESSYRYRNDVFLNNSEQINLLTPKAINKHLTSEIDTLINQAEIQNYPAAFANLAIRHSAGQEALHRPRTPETRATAHDDQRMVRPWRTRRMRAQHSAPAARAAQSWLRPRPFATRQCPHRTITSPRRSRTPRPKTVPADRSPKFARTETGT